MCRACRMLSFGVGEAVIELSMQSYSTGTYCKSVFIRTFLQCLWRYIQQKLLRNGAVDIGFFTISVHSTLSLQEFLTRNCLAVFSTLPHVYDKNLLITQFRERFREIIVIKQNFTLYCITMAESIDCCIRSQRNYFEGTTWCSW
jgi:hypothetical protein